MANKEDFSEIQDKKYSRISNITGSLASTIAIIVVIIGGFSGYIKLSTVSSTDFSAYKEAQSEKNSNLNRETAKVISDSIKESLAPVIENLSKLSLDIGQLKGDIYEMQTKMAQMSVILNGSELVKTQDLYSFKSQNSQDLQDLKLEISRIQTKIEEIQSLKAKIDQVSSTAFTKSQQEVYSANQIEKINSVQQMQATLSRRLEEMTSLLSAVVARVSTLESSYKKK